MLVTQEDLNDLLGSEEHREESIEEALTEGRASYGPISLRVRNRAEILEVEGPFFSTVYDLQQLSDVEEIRSKIDDYVAKQTEKYITRRFWKWKDLSQENEYRIEEIDSENSEMRKS